jgi:XTP/dITP diphosphohydrolase
MRIYAATGNAGKLAEFVREAGPGLEVLRLPGIERIPPCEETGATFEENARLKAAYYSGFCDGLVFADDSGIEADALDGAPGVRSARYSGTGDDDANNARLLEQMRGVPDDRRTGRFVCVIAAARAGRVVGVFRGAAEGMIARDLRGTNGFGYDPLFYYPPLQRTFAELTPEEKWQHSHRGKAFRALRDALPGL